MADTEVFNIVLTGENFPVTSVEPTDFEFLGRPAMVQARIPVLVDLVAGEFRVIATPDRVEFTVVKASATEDKLAALQQNALTFLNEYAGKRSVAAVGHNLQMAFLPTELDREWAFDGVLPNRRLARALGVTALDVGELLVGFRQGDETRATLRIGAGDDGVVRAAFNYHFDIGRTENSAEAAIRKLPDSLAGARAMIDLLPHIAAAQAEA